MEAYELLMKSIHKDSLASAEHFILATLFIDTTYQFYDIDSAYYYIIQAKNLFNQLESKQQEKLIGSGYSLTSYDTLQQTVETAGFVRAVSLGREEDYINFLKLFPYAVQVDSAVSLRNDEAFNTALATNTYESYQEFFTKYPEASQVNEAKKRYHQLLFEVKTADRKLASFKKFLQDFPNTWHREEVEKAIFDIITGKNRITAYQQFIDEHPESYLVEQAKLYSYALLNQEKRLELLNSEYFSEKVRDSLIEITSLKNNLFTLGHNGVSYTVLREDGSILLDSLDRVAENNKCQPIKDYLLLLEPESNHLINLNGDEVVRGDFTSFKIPYSGFIDLEIAGRHLILHQDGSATTGKEYETAKFVGGFIAFKEQGKWGVESITGKRLYEPVLDTIYQALDYIIVSESGEWDIIQPDALFPKLDQEEIELSLPYDSIALVRNNQFIIFSGTGKSLLNKNLEIIIPMGEYYLELLDDGYFIEAGDSILDSRLGDNWYNEIDFNDKWIIGSKLEFNEIYYAGKKVLDADQAETVGNTAIRIEIGQKTYCYFNPDSRIEMRQGEDIKPIRKMGTNSVIRHYLYTDHKHRQAVIDQQGKRIKLPKFDRLIDLGEDYMILSVKSLVYNILDNKGNVILRNVDAATSLDSGYISYLSKTKFGLFNIRNSTHIEPRYDKPLKRFNEQLFVVEEDGYLGLIDRFDSLYLSPKYEEIRVLNDSIVVLKANFRWSFWDLNKGKVLLDNVSDYWEYRTNDELYVKIFKGIGYGLWQTGKGIILNPTYTELEIRTAFDKLLIITEKWVEEADLVILLYYNREGALLRKSVLTTRQYEDLHCQNNF